MKVLHDMESPKIPEIRRANPGDLRVFLCWDWSVHLGTLDAWRCEWAYSTPSYWVEHSLA